MTEQPQFKGKGVRKVDLLLCDRQNRVWEVQANKRTFTMLKDEYPDARGWAFSDDTLLPEYGDKTRRMASGEPQTVVGYKTLDRKDLEHYYKRECEFSAHLFQRTVYWQEMAMHWRKECQRMASKQQQTNK